jgi:hypothetical protein
MVINSQSTLWLVDPGSLTQPSGTLPRRINAGPLLDLNALRTAIASKRLSDQDVWPATRRCRNSLEDYGWSFGFVLEILACLMPADYKNSEWCDVDGRRTIPCDVYRVGFDEIHRIRNSKAGEVYLKFSINERGALTLVLVQSHFS